MPYIWLYEDSLIDFPNKDRWHSRDTVKRIQNKQREYHIPKITSQGCEYVDQ